MKTIHWIWSAVLADFGLFFSAPIQSKSQAALMAVVLAHALASAVVATGTYLLLPTRFQKPRAAVWMLMFTFAFIAPVIGAIGILILTRMTLRKRLRKTRFAVPAAVDLPEFDVQTKATHRGSHGAVRSRLAVDVPDDIRMQSLLTLQAAPQRAANPILEGLLGDSTDDVRLVAFGMLDAKETRLFNHIKREREALLDGELPISQRRACLVHLGELHWELVYSALAQGELRRHILEQARKYLDAALALDMQATSGMLFLKGRILLAQGELGLAQEFIQLAIAAGYPSVSALPYLAEAAFINRDFEYVRLAMQQLVVLNVASKTRAIADLWTGRDNVSKLSDRRYLPHI
jgi:polysaccharide biosynthesis protein PelE